LVQPFRPAAEEWLPQDPWLPGRRQPAARPAPGAGAPPCGAVRRWILSWLYSFFICFCFVCLTYKHIDDIGLRKFHPFLSERDCLKIKKPPMLLGRNHGRTGDFA
jgi:hypothetical protein